MTSKLKGSLSLFLCLYLLAELVADSYPGHSGEYPSGDSSVSAISLMEPSPDWRLLERFQKSITRAEFESTLKKIYDTRLALLEYANIDDTQFELFSDKAKSHRLWTLYFSGGDDASTKGSPTAFDKKLLAGISLLDRPPTKPLEGFKIALDPGHIGGEWALLEERHFTIGNHPPVREADLTLTTAKLLEAQLQEAGANVVWAKNGIEPTTQLRPKDTNFWAIQRVAYKNESLLLKTSISSHWLGRLNRAVDYTAGLYFYRTAEIQARAKLLEKHKPDLTLCIHFNAAPWTSRTPSLYNANKLVVFVHGSYLPEEIIFDDMKFHLLEKLLSRNHEIEIPLAEKIGDQMRAQWGWRAENYGDWNVTHSVSPNPYVWARNLLANRLFDGPVVFVEGPYMNDKVIFYRLIEGDYEGVRTIQKKEHRSIFREFAQIMFDAVLDHAKSHPKKNSP